MVADFERMNEVWSQWFTPGETPARATSQVTFDEADIRLGAHRRRSSEGLN